VSSAALQGRPANWVFIRRNAHAFGSCSGAFFVLIDSLQWGCQCVPIELLRKISSRCDFADKDLDLQCFSEQLLTRQSSGETLLFTPKEAHRVHLFALWFIEGEQP
jgi:hypothetical protein